MNLSDTCNIDYDGTHLGYKEKIVIATEPVRCCESGVIVPIGQPYALCSLAWCDGLDGSPEEDENGEYIVKESDWSPYPQCLEIWRLMRSWRRNAGACFPFASVVDELCQDDTQDYRIAYAQFRSVSKKAKARYEDGKGPKLQMFEQASLDSGEWSPVIPYHDGESPYFRPQRST